MFALENNKLKISVNQIGAELCEIKSVKHKTDFMWDANPAVWGSFAPNLFPIIGALKEDTYTFENIKYTLPKHGFIRNNNQVKLLEQTPNSLSFGLTYSDDSLKIYPFKFEFYLTYKLSDNKIDVIHTVKNVDNKTMYFSVGGHPAFKCPVFKDENYEDYSLEFETIENSKNHLINMENGLISSKTQSLFNNSNTIPLNHELFNADALVYKDLKSRKVSLKSANKGKILSVNFPDFSYLGIWAKPNGNYVCIEPWLGIADSETTNQNIKDKEGILTIAQNKTFTATYTIEIHNNHLV
jgi:galactose mutarotase-like enzyme